MVFGKPQYLMIIFLSQKMNLHFHQANKKKSGFYYWKKLGQNHLDRIQIQYCLKLFDLYLQFTKQSKLIISGNSKEVIRSLTGCPAEAIKTDLPNFKELFINLVKKKCLMTTGTISETNDKDMKGLIFDHAYSVLKLKTIHHPTKGEVTLIKLRNPWGKKEWTGEWNEDSPLWTEELKKKLKIQQGQKDGVFYMPYEDFIQYFSTIYVGHFKKNYVNTAQTIVSKSNRSTYFIFNNDIPGEYYFMAQQKSIRHYNDKQSNYEYSPIRILLAQQINKSYVLKQAKHEKDQQVFVGGFFEKGKVAIDERGRVYNYSSNCLRRYLLKIQCSTYGPKEVNLRQIDKDQPFIKQILLNLANQNPQRQNSGFSNLEIISNFHIEYGIGYEYYQNTGNDSIQVKGTLSVLQGLKLKKPEKGNQYEITLKPQSKYLIAYTLEADGFQRQIQREYSATKL